MAISIAVAAVNAVHSTLSGLLGALCPSHQAGAEETIKTACEQWGKDFTETMKALGASAHYDA